MIAHRAPVWVRLHHALLHDYNPRAAHYWWTMVGLGAVVLVASLIDVASMPPMQWLLTVVGIALAVISSMFPLRIPRTTSHFAIGDIFVFMVLLFVGPSAACLAAAIEGFATSLRSAKRWSSRLGTVAIASCSMFAVSQLAHPTLAMMAANVSKEHFTQLTLAMLVVGAAYGLLSAFLMSRVTRLKRNESFAWKAFIEVFTWFVGANAVAAAVASLLYVLNQLLGSTALLTTMPIVGLVLSTLHFFSSQQDAVAKSLEHQAALTAMQAQQREAQMTADYVAALSQSERRFNGAFTHASIGMALIDRHGVVQMTNPALQQLIGVDAQALAAKPFADFMVEASRVELQRALGALSGDRSDAAVFEAHCVHQDGHEVTVSVNAAVFLNDSDEGKNVILQVQDITARRRAESELHHRAFHDKLTGLPNREFLLQSLRDSIEWLRGGQGSANFAVYFLDFDRFKLINDSNGHSVGDQFLIGAAKRLQQTLRTGDLLARLGGDEFAILARNIANETQAADLAERLQTALGEPLTIGALELISSASIGITLSDVDYQRAEDMVRDADIAMYRAKQNGKARHAFFDVALINSLTHRVRLEADMRVALQTKSLQVAYQPLYELRTGEIEGFEALARWNHPELGPISPGVFIPIAEESGLITQWTSLILNEACQRLKQWQIDHPGCSDLCMHVNVAGHDLVDPSFVDRVQQALRRCNLDPKHLVIELTENILMAQLAASMESLRALRDMGVRLSVDDFGTGYSSLSHLSTLPIDSLKIDMSFVRPLQEGSKEAAVIRAIVLLGVSLGKTIVAEGIETRVQWDLLRELGCHVGQGYFMSRPIDASAIDSLLRTRLSVEHSLAANGSDRPSLKLVGATST